MAVSIALVLLMGLFADYIFRKMRLPGLLGMLLVGILSGPHILNILSPELLKFSADFRTLALIVILLRAGLRTGRDTLNKVGRTVAAMSTVPSIFEGAAVAYAGHFVFGIGYLESALLGFAVAAVSPAVIVPSMIRLSEEKRGMSKGIPSLILASSAMDNAFTIAVFTVFLGMQGGAGMGFIGIPVSIVLGACIGAAVGFVLVRLFSAYRPRATKKVMVVLGVAVLMLYLEKAVKSAVPFSAIVGVMAIGFILLEKAESAAHAVSGKLGKIWVPAEILLFVLVGAQVDIGVAWGAGLAGVGVILAGLLARGVGTYLSASGSGLNNKEKLFCVVSYIPKATVQAAIGALPLEAGVKSGGVILAVAVLSILITAPIGAIGITLAGRRWLRGD